MIPAIGFMIGFYIIARAIEMLFKDYKGVGAKITMGIVAIALIIITAMSMVDLYSASQSTSRSLSNISNFQ